MRKSLIAGLILLIAIVFAAIGASSAGTDESAITRITLGSKITISGTGATINGSDVEITESGSYSITGTLKGGVIRVTTMDAVFIELDGASVKNSDGPVLTSNGDVTIDLKSWTCSTLANTNHDAEDEVVSVGGNLVIMGSGLLEVLGNYCSGISVSGDVTVSDGTIKLYALNDGISGRGEISLNGGSIAVDCDGKGIYSKGELTITGGKVISVGGAGDGEGGLLSDVGLKVTGGTVIATGNKIAANTGSTQTSIYAETGARMDAGDCFYIMYDSEGMFAFAPSNAYSNLYYSSADLVEGETYDIHVGGKIKNMFSNTIYTSTRYFSGVQDIVLSEEAKLGATGL